MKSVHINQAKFLQLEVNKLSPSYWHFDVSTRDWGKVSTARGLYYYIESQYLPHVVSTHHWGHVLLLEVTTTTMSPSYWHYDVSTRDWGKVSTARGLYYYIESQYLTHVVSTHHWGHVLLLEVTTTTMSPSYWHYDVSTRDWGKVSTARGLYYHIESQYLTHEEVHIPEAMFLLLSVSITTLCQNVWNMKSVHITETNVLLLDVSTTTLSPSIWHHGVSTHDWIKVSTAGALYYYIESQYLTTEVSTYP